MYFLQIFSILFLTTIVQCDKSIQDNLQNNSTNANNENCNNLISHLINNNSTDDLYNESTCSSVVQVSNVSLLCRQDVYILVEWFVMYRGNESWYKSIEYLVEISQTDAEGKWHEHGWSKNGKYKVDGLNPGTDYMVRITPYFMNTTISQSAVSSLISTFYGNESLQSINDIYVNRFISKNGFLSAYLNWLSTEDRVCQTAITIYQENSLDLLETRVVVGDLFYNLEELEYSTVYVITMFSFVSRSESGKTTYTFQTPNCLEFNHYDLTFCVPDAPENVTIVDDCDHLKVSWNKPKALPDYYSIAFYFSENVKNFTVAGNETQMIVEVEDYEKGFYFINIFAVGPAGQSKPIFDSGQSVCGVKMNSKYLSSTEIVPVLPINLRVEGKCQPEVLWEQPYLFPDYYIISITSNHSAIDHIVKGEEVGFTLEDDFKGSISITVTAYSSGSVMGRNTVSAEVNCDDQGHSIQDFTESYEYNWIAALITTFIAVPAAFGAVSWGLYIFVFKKSEQKDIFDTMTPEDSFRKEIHSKTVDEIQPNNVLSEDKSISEDMKVDEYEVNSQHIQLCQVLGHGEFGLVHKAVLAYNSCSKYVAVKTLRNKNSIEEKRQLEKEMEVMKSVGKHRNIVSLVGCCTRDMMLVVEYCSLGDLRTFLRKAWRLNSCIEDSVSDESNKDLLDRRAFSNILYDHSDSEKRYLNLSMIDLLSFARQIALGMAYLSENRVVHRDLAARNVLLADDMTAKIADFGMSRDVYERNFYMKRSSDRLPLRWMAIESLLYQVFSTKSDVWSYGILLWEIMTLGGCPYPSLQTSEMFRLLQQGYRMERPKPCCQNMYDIMLSCWDAKPMNRPSFPQLVIKVEEIMNNDTNRPYLDLTACQYKSHLDKGSDIK